MYCTLFTVPTWSREWAPSTFYLLGLESGAPGILYSTYLVYRVVLQVHSNYTVIGLQSGGPCRYTLIIL